MYAELIENLTAEDRKALAEQGVPSSRVSEWKTGFRVPTRPQALALASVKGVDYMELEKELVMIEATEEAKKKPAMASLLERIRIL
ncbi:hypothetical protein [Acidovorax delafieldii]|jgi:hypothetical protein|uniref:hypothetical protein n=1 Tax=Acidovorax delafieldii TaxID=47920 RepID=UPI003ECEFE07